VARRAGQRQRASWRSSPQGELGGPPARPMVLEDPRQAPKLPGSWRPWLPARGRARFYRSRPKSGPTALNGGTITESI
jgi:hypothetical protein